MTPRITLCPVAGPAAPPVTRPADASAAPAPSPAINLVAGLTGPRAVPPMPNANGSPVDGQTNPRLPPIGEPGTPALLARPHGRDAAATGVTALHDVAAVSTGRERVAPAASRRWAWGRGR